MSQTYPFAVPAREFTGKRVLVTGGTKGVGRVIAQRFQLAGAKVATTARSPSPDNQDGPTRPSGGGCRTRRFSWRPIVPLLLADPIRWRNTTHDDRGHQRGTGRLHRASDSHVIAEMSTSAISGATGRRSCCCTASPTTRTSTTI